MRIAISNIAWDIDEDEYIIKLLNKYHVDAIDIAPAKYFPDLSIVSDSDIKKVKSYWQNHGIEITGMQSLLFGTQGLNIFSDFDVKQSLLSYLGKVCRTAELLEAPRLVFGSPKNRDKTGLTDEQAFTDAVAFFIELGKVAEEHGVIICLEPNPTYYGANFMTNSLETLKVVKAVNHPNIKMQLDTGAVLLNKESIQDVLSESAPYIGHIHISEPNLVPVGTAETDHKEIAEALKILSVNQLISIEMLTSDSHRLESIENALILVTQIYRGTF